MSASALVIRSIRRFRRRKRLAKRAGRSTEKSFDGSLLDALCLEQLTTRRVDWKRRILLWTYAALPTLNWGVLMWMLIASESTNPVIVVPLRNWLLIIVCVISASYYKKARQACQRGPTVLRKDSRRPVLYLRPFLADDEWGDKTDAPPAAHMHGMGMFYLYRTSTVETRLVGDLRRIGPVRAIGRHDEDLPPLGPARFYVGDRYWRDFVAAFAALARIVVLRLGQSAGIFWELKHLREQCDPCKVFLRSRSVGARPGIFGCCGGATNRTAAEHA